MIKFPQVHSAITVDLSNVNTSEAGNVTVNGATVGSLSSTFPNASIFTRNGLTLHLLGVSSNTYGNYDTIQAKTFDDLTDDQKTIVAGLFKWWVAEGLKLSEESYGIGFNSSTAALSDMGLYFYDGKGVDKTLAAVQYWQQDSDGATTKLLLKVNMNYFARISAKDVDGTSTNPSIKQILDRTLAHELTHANMQANINYFKTLPQFITEGSAELIHGIDDERGNRIFSVAASDSLLANVLDVTDFGTGNANCYAGGYMFLRYFAKQAAAQTLPAFGEITATVNPSSNGSYYISGNSTSETASTSAKAIKLGTVSNGTYTVENTGVHQVINNNNNLKIAGLTVNDSLIGSSKADIIQTATGSYITSGDGADSISLYGQYATISTGAGNDTVIAQDGGHHFIELGNGNDYVEFKASSVYNNTISAGAGNDSVNLTASQYSSIEMGAGDDSIYFGGKNNTISTGDGNDTLKSRYTNDNENFIELGAGDDRATVYGNDNTIIGGAGNDYIYNNSGENVVFKYSAGDGNDLIYGFDETSRLIIGGGLGTYTKFEKGSDLIFKIGTGTITLSGAANLSTLNVEGQEKISTLIEGTEDADTINNVVDDVMIMAYGGDDVITNSGDNVLIDGGADNDSVKLNGAGATVNVSEGNDTISFDKSITSFQVTGFNSGDVIQLNSKTSKLATIDGGLIAGSVTISGVELPTTSKEWSLSDNVATHEMKISAGATLSEDNKSIVYGAASSESVTVSGIGSTDGLEIDTDNKIVTVNESALIEQSVAISDGYNLALGDAPAPKSSGSMWSLNDTTAIYGLSMTAGYTLEDNKIIYNEAGITDTVVAVSGVGSTDGLKINTSKKIVTVQAASLNEEDVTISDGYTLKLSDAPAPTVLAGDWNLDDTTAIYKASSTTAGYTLADNKISYTAASGGKSLVTVSGVGSTDGLAIDTANKIVTVQASALNEEDVTISDGYTLALGDDAPTPVTTNGSWSLDKTTAIYKASGKSAGYTLDDNQIIYNKASDGATLIELRGVASTPTVKGNTVQLSKDNFSKDVSIISGDGYSFELKDGNYSGKTFYGSDDGDRIKNNGLSVTIAGGKGNDTLTGGKRKDFLSGDDGDDILTGGKGNDTLAYSTGNDTITDYDAKDKISLSSAYENFSVNGSDVIFNFGDNNSLTLTKAAGKQVNFLSGKKTTSNFYTVEGVFDKKKKSVTLSASAENFSAAKYSKLITIDGSATGAIEIVGNKKKNKIYAGTGGSSITGGKGNDTLYGGAGADVFIYNKGDRKDVIENFGAEDKIVFGSGATIKSSTVKGGNTIIKIGSGSLTVKNTTEVAFIEDDTEKVFVNGNIADPDKISVTLSSLYKGKFELGDYEKVDASLTKRAVTLIGNDKNNYLRGGMGKDSLIGGAGNDTLWGGKKNDMLTGGDGDDVFIYQAGQGNDVITDYAAGDMLQILDKKGETGTFTDSTFTGKSLTLNIQGGGKVTFDNVAASSTFNINGASYHISDKTLTKD